MELSFNKGSERLKADLSQTDIFEYPHEMLEREIWIEVALYPLDDYVHVFSRHLVWHAAEEIHHETCLNQPLLRRFVYVGVVFEYLVQDLLLSFW